MDENNILDGEQLDETNNDVSVTGETDTEDNIEVALDDQEEELEGRAITSVVNGMISDSYLDYFEGIVNKLSFEEHYVVWRSGDYSYSLAYGEDIEETSGGFVGNCEVVEIYRQGDGYNYQWVTAASSGDLNLSVGSAFVYSDLGMYPTLERGMTSIEADILLCAVTVAFVFSVVSDIFSHVVFRRR